MGVQSGDDPYQSIAEAFGHPSLRESAVTADERSAFLRAGFSEAQAARGVRMLGDGSFGDLEMVAHMLQRGPGFDLYGPDNRLIAPRVSEASIAEAARVLTRPSADRQIQERLSVTASHLRLLESGKATASGEARFDACIISAGEGSSAHYSTAVLEQAARDRIFAKGTHSYIDHADGYREMKDLAGCLEADATYRDGALWSTLRIYSSHREFVTERADVIGVSIKAYAETVQEASKAKPTVTRLTHADSVDLVTRAGRGGFLVGAA